MIEGLAAPPATGERGSACARRRAQALLGLLIALALVKLAILVLLGPSFLPDSPGYLSFADAILDHGRAFAPIPWGSEAAPNLVFRTAGYPLLLAGAKLLSPSHGAALVILFQGALGLAATALVVRVAERLLGSTGAALSAGLVYGLSEALLWDNSILPDSLYAALFIIVVFSLLGHAVGSWRLGLPRLVGLAVLWGYSIWTRDNGIYFTLFPLLICLWIATARPRLERRRFGFAVAFLLVTAGMSSAYVALNWYRTGGVFLGITGVENWLRPVFDMQRYGYARPFDGDSLVARTAREEMTGEDFGAQLRFLAVLHQRCRCTSPELQSLVLAEFLSAARRHPVAYLRVVWRNFNYLGLAELVADPVTTVNLVSEFGTRLERRVIPGLSVRTLSALSRHFSATDLLLVMVSTLTAALALVLFTLFLFGVPGFVLRALRGRETLSEPLAAVGFLWLTFLGVAGAFALVHLEARHVLPILPAAVIGTIYVLQRLARRHGLPAELPA